jgi:hypothetical protein
MKFNVIIIKLDEEFLHNTNVMVFASENYDLINRWVCIVNYFVNK